MTGDRQGVTDPRPEYPLDPSTHHGRKGAEPCERFDPAVGSVPRRWAPSAVVPAPGSGWITAGPSGAERAGVCAGRGLVAGKGEG